MSGANQVEDAFMTEVLTRATSQLSISSREEDNSGPFVKVGMSCLCRTEQKGIHAPESYFLSLPLSLSLSLFLPI